MSHILFGDFFSEKTDSLSKEKIRAKLAEDDVYIFFDEQMNFYNDVFQMLAENKSNNSNTSFCLTSINQKYNSDDLLYPFDKYGEDELFPDGTEGDREWYEQLCLQNLTQLQNSVTKILEFLEVKFFRIFITDGYDTELDVCCCTIEEMIKDIYRQVTEDIGLNSKIYLLEN